HHGKAVVDGAAGEQAAEQGDSAPGIGPGGGLAVEAGALQGPAAAIVLVGDAGPLLVAVAAAGLQAVAEAGAHRQAALHPGGGAAAAVPVGGGEAGGGAFPVEGQGEVGAQGGFVAVDEVQRRQAQVADVADADAVAEVDEFHVVPLAVVLDGVAKAQGAPANARDAGVQPALVGGEGIPRQHAGAGETGARQLGVEAGAKAPVLALGAEGEQLAAPRIPLARGQGSVQYRAGGQ